MNEILELLQSKYISANWSTWPAQNPAVMGSTPPTFQFFSLEPANFSKLVDTLRNQLIGDKSTMSCVCRHK